MKLLKMIFSRNRERLAGVYLFRDRLIVAISHLLVNGPWREESACLVENRSNPSAVGAAVRQALDASREGVPARDDPRRSSMMYPALTASGAKSHASFMKSALYVGVMSQGAEIVVTPYSNEGARGGFTALQRKARSLTDPTDTELGTAVLAAFELAE